MFYKVQVSPSSLILQRKTVILRVIWYKKRDIKDVISFLSTGCPPKRLAFQIQTSALINTAYSVA